MNEEQIYNLLCLVKQGEEIEIHNETYLHTLWFVQIYHADNWRMRWPLLLDAWKVFLENYDRSWKWKIEREWWKYDLIHNKMYLPVITFLLWVLISKIWII